MTRTNMIYLVVGALVVATAALGYQLYQERNKQGVEINFSPNGISVEEK